ncbi:hypothetical protein PTKIN_Ptkin09bG0106800 [Pterospermum kingtungense]
MDWFFKQKGPGYKQGRTDQTITSPSAAPPLPALSIFGIICLLLYVSYTNNKKEIQHTVVNLKLFLLFLPLVFILAAQFVSKWERLVVPYPRTKREMEYRSWDLPWGVVLLVLLLLVVVSYQS